MVSKIARVVCPHRRSRQARSACTAPVVAVAIVAAAAVASGEASWTRVAPRDFVFAAQMPVPPDIEEMQNSSFLGTTRSVAYYSNHGGNRFNVTVTEIPRAARWITPSRVLYAATRSRLLDSVEAQGEVSFAEIERDGVEGRRLVFVAKPPDEPPRHGRAEIFYLDGRLVVAVGSHEHDASDAMLERFFANLRLDLQRCRDGDTDDERCRVDLAVDD